MTTLNESRAWGAATAGYGGVREWHAYNAAAELPPVAECIIPDGHGYCPTAPHPTMSIVSWRTSDTDSMLTREDTTAERGGNPLVAASLLAAVGIVLGIILAVIL